MEACRDARKYSMTMRCPRTSRSWLNSSEAIRIEDDEKHVHCYGRRVGGAKKPIRSWGRRIAFPSEVT
jgi:hypothetical protein